MGGGLAIRIFSNFPRISQLMAGMVAAALFIFGIMAARLAPADTFTWSGAGEMIVLEGHANLKGTLWRVGLDGRRAEVLADVPLRLSYVLDQTNAPTVRFDVSPDGRRMALEALEFYEADIGMIDNVR